MKIMLVEGFKAKVIATMRRVRETGEPVLVTLRGEPLVEVVPAREAVEQGVSLGAGRGLIRKRPSDEALVGVGFASDWELNG
jgi:prevent-host-death family protein